MKCFRFLAVLIFAGVASLAALGQSTPYLDLNLPPYASGNWNVPVNQNFSILDNYLGGVTPFPNPLQTNITGTAAGALPIAGGTITGNLIVDGTFTCLGCAGSTFPGAGIPNSNGTTYDTSYSDTNPIPADFVSILNQNTTGTAANLTAPALLPNGTTAITQTLGDSSQDLANDQFVSNTLASPPAYGSDTPATGTSQFTNLQAFGNSAANNFSIGSSIVLPSSLVGYHGTSGTKVQLSDGTGTPGFSAVFASDGSITNGTAPPYVPSATVPDQFQSGSCSGSSNCTITITWGTAYPDTSYFVAVTPTSLDAHNGADYGAAQWVISSQTTTQIVITVSGTTGYDSSIAATVNVWGHHP